MRGTKQWNYIEILQSITYLLSDITESRDAIASKNQFHTIFALASQQSSVKVNMLGLSLTKMVTKICSLGVWVQPIFTVYLAK